ncbi:ABC transporter permease [Dehalococcoides mccartyi]|uniref:ABC-type dipeptide/oligopeptide/nickel transport system, permease component n=1 Tax=Dehalococcoides mccartyi (strain VS) TaxID=311424 RepID=D2BJ70_DEHMV|nr:ABC transporter permease [Dehalococcoides mccartyi]ACZ62370.1 ABC-type dipeptide/oligopeptide/nickel transport system, permease component [Dehalococcoides mccartyi VS]
MQRHYHPAAGFLGKALRYGIVLLVVIALNFLIPRVMPGDPVKNILGEQAYYTAEDVAALSVELGLDKPIYQQFGDYLGGLFGGDWGYSYLYMQPVLEAVGGHLLWTLVLILPAIILGALLAGFAGLVAGYFRKTPLDIGLTSGFMLIYAMPHYWIAMLMLMFFSFNLGWFPMGKVTSGGLSGLAYFTDLFWHMALPLLVVTLFKAAYDFLIMRNTVISICGEDYILMARAKGLSRGRILFKHILRNSLAPLVTVTAIQFGMLFSGVLLVETVFSWPGMGTLIYEAIGARDYPLIQGAFLIIAVCVLLANMTADLLYRRLDPRVA